jgi:hypothetical protein
MVSLNQCFIESSDRQELLQIANRKEELHDINQNDVFSGSVLAAHYFASG